MIYATKPRLQALVITADPERCLSVQANAYRDPSLLIADLLDQALYDGPYIPESITDSEIEAALVAELGGYQVGLLTDLPDSLRLYIELKY